MMMPYAAALLLKMSDDIDMLSALRYMRYARYDFRHYFSPLCRYVADAAADRG